jgi:hypothetical protein
VWQRVEPLDRPGDNEVRDRRVSLQVDERHVYYLDGSLVHGTSQVDMQTNSYWKDQAALLDARGRSSYQPPTGSRHEVCKFVFFYYRDQCLHPHRMVD